MLWDKHPEPMRIALARHDAILRTAIEGNNGVVFKTVGDAFCAAFATAADGLAAAVESQLALQAEPWDPNVTLRARMGLHTGAAEYRDNDYFGPPLNRVARLMSVGHGGQILISSATQELVIDHLPPGASLRSMGSHRLKDLGRPETIFQVDHNSLPADFAPLRSLGNPALPNNLPQQVTSFVGREREFGEVKSLVASSRLVTLTAAGGTGKTRLSLQVAADMLDQFPDGVWLIELAALTDADLVASTIARTVGVNETAGEPILKTLTRELRSRRLLIIFDNCEHLVAACASVADALLRGCTDIHILASSRQALNIAGESVYALSALSLPDPKKPQTPESLSQYAAVCLFIDRAVAARADFTVTNQNAASLAQLCHRLDGIPLALELAAARVRVLSVEEINARLDNRFRLLTGGSRTALPRQQTLRALIDWSYDLLNEQERALFMRLSIFVGGWTPPAAEQICAGEDIEDWEVFDLLTALTDKSLAVPDAEAAEARFRMLETLREYGREKLEASTEGDGVARLHAEYYAGMVNSRMGAPAEPGEADFAWALLEWDNIRAALDWFWKAGEVAAAATLSVNLREFWTRKGWLREASTYLDRAAHQIQAIGDPGLGARVLKDAGWFAFLLGDLRRAEELTSASVQTAQKAGVTDVLANALNGLALIVQALDDPARAEALFEQSIALVRTLGKDMILADYLMNLGFLKSTRGEHEKAQVLFSEARSIYEARSNPRGMAAWLCNQSDLALRKADWSEAQAFAEQSVERFRQIDNRLGIAYALANQAEAAARLANHSVTASSVTEAIVICRETNHYDLLPILFMTEARSHHATGNAERAMLWLAGSLRLRTILNMPARGDEEKEVLSMTTSLRELETDRSLDVVQTELTSVDADTLISRLLPLA